MKRNVDLTEDGIFTTPEPLTGVNKILWDWVENLSRKPWEFNFISLDSDFDLSICEKSLIAIGDKKARERWRKGQLEHSNEICDWCGQSRGKFPWAKKECRCYSTSTTKKIPWDFD